ncbi:MAG TPA: hypothetical protein VIQ30_02320 [Pseudonocardia sp.]
MPPSPIENSPDRFRGELDGHSAAGSAIYLITVRVDWDDGTTTFEAGWTHQWTKSHVYAVLEETPPAGGYRQHPDQDPMRLWVRADQVSRRSPDPVQF